MDFTQICFTVLGKFVQLWWRSYFDEKKRPRLYVYGEDFVSCFIWLYFSSVSVCIRSL